LKLRIALVCAALVALALPIVASAGSPTDRATGGGQVLIGTRGGAGDTIAFTAQDREDNPGQVQYIDRTEEGQTKYHGRVACLMVMDNMAYIGGSWDNQGAGDFNLYVEDNGQGANAAGADMIFIDEAADNPMCDFDEPEDEDQLDLARGNTQVYDADGGEQEAAQETAGLSFLGL
jgi:hypothetical protein